MICGLASHNGPVAYISWSIDLEVFLICNTILALMDRKVDHFFTKSDHVKCNGSSDLYFIAQ